MEGILEKLVTPGVGYGVAGIIVLAIILHHWRQMALIRSGLIKKYGVRKWSIDRDNLFGGLVLVTLGGVIFAAKFYHYTFWQGFWIFICLLGLDLIVLALLGRERWHRSKS